MTRFTLTQSTLVQLRSSLSLHTPQWPIRWAYDHSTSPLTILLRVEERSYFFLDWRFFLMCMPLPDSKSCTQITVIYPWIISNLMKETSCRDVVMAHLVICRVVSNLISTTYYTCTHTYIICCTRFITYILGYPNPTECGKKHPDLCQSTLLESPLSKFYTPFYF
jgi:hypothetical protein